jgi:Carbamoyl-phosphate synthase small chain, CPSase domain
MKLREEAISITPRADRGGKAVLVLEDGTVFWGKGLGCFGQTLGEVCFNTAMTGYQEILTDPSYAGQIITFTFPHIGNVGANDEDVESRRPTCRGLVLREDITPAANWRAQTSMDRWLKDTTASEGHVLMDCCGRISPAAKHIHVKFRARPVGQRSVVNHAREDACLIRRHGSSRRTDYGVYRPPFRGLVAARRVGPIRKPGEEHSIFCRGRAEWPGNTRESAVGICGSVIPTAHERRGEAASRRCRWFE